ncbi:MAG TPA: hypothetical protein VM099_03630 [Gemmatimonadaceae bacterium]|nr:hypothetical protein [Gemmatimonadaceae bacterium]
MPSRAETRSIIESVLSGVVIVVLGILLWNALQHRGSMEETTYSARGTASFADWTTRSNAPPQIHVSLDNTSSPIERDWMRALAAAGSRVTWNGNLPALMIAAAPAASPAGGTRVRVAAPDGSNVIVRDDVGVVDTVRAQNAGASLALTSESEATSASVNGSRASTRRSDSLRLGKILVIGNAGWESKFVTAALEEEGWKVDAFIKVAPDVDVTQGSIASIDTSRYSAVVAVDGGAAAYAGRIIEFVRNGGGLLLAPAAAVTDAMSALRPGAATRAPASSSTIQAAGSVTLATLPLGPIASLRSDAVPLEKRASSVAIAARRIGAGRVLQSGYEDTWRWRMGGGANAMRDHRLWWSGLLSRVAYAPRISRAPIEAERNAAPLASLVAAVGQASPVAIQSSAQNAERWTLWLFVLLSLSVLAMVASRRLRGVK